MSDKDIPTQLTCSIPLRVSSTYREMFSEYIKNDAFFHEMMAHKGIPVMLSPSDNMIPDMHNCIGFVTSICLSSAVIVPIQRGEQTLLTSMNIFGIKPHMLIDGKNQKIVRITEFVLCGND